MSCEQLLDEISIKVMLEKDPVGWKSYSPLTDEERRMCNAMVSPPVNPHPFVSDVFEQAGVTHLSSAGGTPTLFYPASTTLPAEGEDGGMPTPILSGGAGSPLGAAPLFADEGVGRRGRLDHFGRVVSPQDWGDASLSTDTTEVTVVATAASDGLPPRVGRGMPPSPLPLRWWPQWMQRTLLRS
jgi:hypothetical protein